MLFNVITLLLISLLHIDTASLLDWIYIVHYNGLNFKDSYFEVISYFTEIHLSGFMSSVTALNLMIPLKIKSNQSSLLWC